MGHDSQDARLHRRIRTFRRLGIHVAWFAFDRRRTATPIPADVLAEDHVLLGVTIDGRYFQRLLALGLGIVRAYRWCRRQPENFHILYAINLDNLVLAMLLKRALTLRAGIVYECADIQPVFLSRGIGHFLRWLETACLRHVQFLVTTSRAFVREYFRSILGFRGDCFLLENKIYADASVLQRSSVIDASKISSAQIRVGVFGAFRCHRSLRLVEAVASQNAAKLEFIFRGYPNHKVQGEFERLRENGVFKYLGPYRYPDDLSLIFSGVDLIWSLDFSAPEGNSRWLLSNRNYEAGYYAVPQLVLAGTEAGRFVEANELGWVFAEPIEASLGEFFQRISIQDINQKSKGISMRDPTRFLSESDLESFGERLATAVPG